VTSLQLAESIDLFLRNIDDDASLMKALHAFSEKATLVVQKAGATVATGNHPDVMNLNNESRVSMQAAVRTRDIPKSSGWPRQFKRRASFHL
jgi:hypothetical protein